MIRLALLAAAVLAGCAVKPVSQPDPIVAVQAEPPKAPEAQPVRHLFFETKQDYLYPGQIRALSRLRAWQGRNPTPLRCTGYADTVGSDSANYALALRRAQAVAMHISCRTVSAGETVDFGALQNNRRALIQPE